MITKAEIIQKIADDRMVEKLVNKIRKDDITDKQDLIQDIYLMLMEYDESKLQEIWNKKQMNFFLVKVVGNNIFSKTSPYYRKYKKFRDLTEEITQEIKDRY